LLFPEIAFCSNLVKVKPQLIHEKAVDFLAQAGNGTSLGMSRRRLHTIMSSAVDPRMVMPAKF
jgi:hypothetical protein